MSTKYTREQIDKARQLADHAFDEGKEDRKYHPGEPHPGATWIDTFTEALGLDVEDEKPEPGTWHFTRTEGWPAYVDTDGHLSVIPPDGDVDLYMPGADDWPDLDPATPPQRVAPAQPVELSEADLEAAYPHDEPNAYGMLTLDAFEPADRRALVRMCQNLVNKHGHGRAEVEREWLRAGIAELRGNGYGLNGEVINIITDAVMDMLEASQ